MTTQVYPVCPQCGRAFEPGAAWHGSNFCKARFLIEYVRGFPGKTAWEISQDSGMLYDDVAKGLTKGRALGLFLTESEERRQGGVRYRYWVGERSQEVIARWLPCGIGVGKS